MNNSKLFNAFALVTLALLSWGLYEAMIGARELQKSDDPSSTQPPTVSLVGYVLGVAFGAIIAIIPCRIADGSVQRLFHLGWALSHHTR